MRNSLGGHVRTADHAPEQIRSGDNAHCLVVRRIDEGFGGQVIEVVACCGRLGGGNDLGLEQLRQPLGKLEVHAMFVFGRVFAGVE
ncbi:hypothetical protein D3C78_1627480 [compost metagenome]